MSLTQLLLFIRTATILLISAAAVIAQTPAKEKSPTFNDVKIIKKDRDGAGEAVITTGQKLRRVARNVYAAYPVVGSDNILLLIREAKLTATGSSQLRYVEGLSKKWKTLGIVPFQKAQVLESTLADGRTSFVLSGKGRTEQSIIVADTNAIHAELHGASDAQIQDKALTYHLSAGTHTVPLADLVGANLAGIYEYKGEPSGGAHFAQFQPDGAAYVIDQAGQTHKGIWRTDSVNILVVESDSHGADVKTYTMLRSGLTHVDGIPAETRLTVRLLHPLSSRTAKEGDAVDAVLISPANLDNKIHLPQGAIFSGTITNGHGVGWAIPHETAALTVEFTSVHLEDGSVLPIRTHLYEVPNAREKVDANGAIKGIRSTGTLGHSAESKVASVAAVEPVAYLFTTVSATAILGFAEPEILYNAGTDLLVEFSAPVLTAKEYPPASPPFTTSPAEHQKLTDFIHALPFRTSTKNNKPSDITSLVFMGKPEALQRAFIAAGWVKSDPLTANSTYMTMKSLGGTQTYNEAPMSVLLLDERPPILTFNKTTNTFNSRHHIRIFDPLRQLDGETVLTASSTQDIGIGFSPKQRTFIHIIDQYIDNERAQVVNDLQFTGCVAAAEYVERPWVPKDAFNSTGDELRTDGATIFLKLTACEHPRTTSNENAVPPARLQRVIRNTVLTLRNDVVRGNVVYQGVSGAILARKYFAHRNDLKPDSGAWLKTDVSGETYSSSADVAADRQPSREVVRASVPATPDPEVIQARESHRWDPPRYEIGLQGGYIRYPQLRTEGVVLVLTPTAAVGGPEYFTGLADQVSGGWSAGIYVIANTWKWFSNEFSYNYQRGRYESQDISASGLGDDLEIDSKAVALVTRQFEYNLLFNLRPPKSRWRPYVAAGPALQLISIDGATVKKPSGPFRLGLQNIGLLKSAFDFGNTPPLEGGGIYQLGLQYGAGLSYRILPRLSMNLDFRETWAKNPDFIRDSYTEEYFSDEFYTLTTTKLGAESKFRQQRFTLGFAFTF